MKNYIIEVSRTAEEDLENIILYIRNELAGDVIADKYKIIFKQELLNLEKFAGIAPVLDENLTGHKNIRKVNVKNYIIFYVINEDENKVSVLRIGHAFMDWEKFLRD